MKRSTLEAARAGATDQGTLYGFTIDSIEPNIHPIDAVAFYASAAISLKRIADALEKFTAPSAGVTADYPFTHKTYDPS